jgi:putative glutamine amidotransferase
MHSVGLTYTRAVHRVGGVPLIIPPITREADWVALLKRLDGLLLTGGEDIAPAHYGQRREAWTGRPDEERDASELGLVRRWLATDKPLLAICRGHQLLSVASGGSLYQEISTHVPNALDHGYVPGRPMERPVHSADLQQNSRLAEILDQDRVEVNSAHHQAVAQPGSGLEIVARAPDGVVEATENPDHPFCLSVQWHPEAMLKVSETMLPLFAAFVAAATDV